MTDLRLVVPCSLIVTGSSQSGKTTLVERMITTPGCFTEDPVEIKWLYSKLAFNQQLFDRLKANAIAPITFEEGFPEDRIQKGTLFTAPKTACKFLILDDIYTELSKPSQTLSDLFNIVAHHERCVIILTVQNLAAVSQRARGSLGTVLRSTNYLCIFVNRRMHPIARYIANNFFPGECWRILRPFDYIIKSEERHQYILCDFTTEREKLMIRQNGILPSETCYGFSFENESDSDQEKEQRCDAKSPTRDEHT